MEFDKGNLQIVVYTAIFGNIDRLWSVCPLASRGAEHIAFSDVDKQQVGIWQQESSLSIRPGTGRIGAIPSWDVRIADHSWSARRTARHYKAMPHRYLDADIWIWLDGNVRLTIPPQQAIKWLGDDDLAIFKHPDRSCLYQEALFCAERHKDKRHILESQMQYYRSQGMPAGWGLPETRCVIRRNTERIRELNEMWWSELEKRSVRDQVSLPFVCWKLGIRWRVIPGRCWVRNTHSDFHFIKHKA